MLLGPGLNVHRVARNGRNETRLQNANPVNNGGFGGTQMELSQNRQLDHFAAND